MRVALAGLLALVSCQAAGRWSPVGPGGGGTVIAPAISPHDDQLMFAGCDMSGAYRSTDGGRSWAMLPGEQIRSVNGYRHSAWGFSVRQPARVFCGTTSAFLVSDDRGATWRALTGPWGQPDWGVSVGPHVFRFDRARPGVGLAAFCAYRKAGQVKLFVTRDDGQTWAAAGDLPGDAGLVLGAAYDGRQPGALVVGCEHGVFRSGDDGATWQRATTGLDQDGRDLLGFAGGSDGRQTRLYATLRGRQADGRYAGGVYRSLDGGASWQPAMGGLNDHVGKEDEWSRDLPAYDFIVCADTRPDVAYVSHLGTRVLSPHHATIYRTTNGGESWQPVLYGDPRMREYNMGPEWITSSMQWGWGAEASGLAVSDTNPQIVLRPDPGRLVLTTDGGATWRQAHAPALRDGAIPNGGMNVTTTWQYVIDPREPERHYICYTDIGCFRSTDGGETWRHAVKGSPWTNTFYALTCDPAVPGRLWAAASNTHDIPYWGYVTRDAAKYPGGVVRSDDYGATWRKVADLGGCTDLWLDPDSPAERRTMLAAVMGKGVARSRDGGATWQWCNEGLDLGRNPNVIRVRRGPDQRLWALVTMKYDPRTRDIRAGGLFCSADGERWTRVNTGQPLWHPAEFAVVPGDGRTVYVSCMEAPAGKAGGGLWRTTDGGASWVRVHHTGPGFAPITDPQDPKVVYHCTYGAGVWLSRDGGAGWSRLEGLPFLNAHRITFDPRQRGRLWVTTFGGGVQRLAEP